MPVLTTILPVFNGERFLPGTLDALARQSRPPDRIVVLDNCSTDRTPEIARQFRGLPCEYRRHPANIGLMNNLNEGLAFAPETDYLHILPVDDGVKLDFFRRILDALEPIPHPAVGYSLIERTNEQGQPFRPRHPRLRPPRRIPLRQFLARQARLQTICCPAVIMKTGRQPVPCRFRPDLPQLADNLFFAEFAARCGHIVEIPEYLAQNRHHPFSASTHHRQQLQTWVLDEWKTMNLVLDLWKESRAIRWLRRRHLVCLFAARSFVKIKLVRASDPEFARAIAAAARALAGRPCWRLARLAVHLRDAGCAALGRPPEIYDLIPTRHAP